LQKSSQKQQITKYFKNDSSTNSNTYFIKRSKKYIKKKLRTEIILYQNIFAASQKFRKKKIQVRNVPLPS
jgi:hypothetical protein